LGGSWIERRFDHADQPEPALESGRPAVGKADHIGAPGFEPGTSPTRTVRATRLRHAPMDPVFHSWPQGCRPARGQVPSRNGADPLEPIRATRHTYGHVMFPA